MRPVTWNRPCREARVGKPSSQMHGLGPCMHRSDAPFMSFKEGANWKERVAICPAPAKHMAHQLTRVSTHRFHAFFSSPGRRLVRRDFIIRLPEGEIRRGLPWPDLDP